MENNYLEPSANGILNTSSKLAVGQDLSPNMEQQVNPGFVQSPTHQQKKPSASELETSFSSKMSSSPPGGSNGFRSAHGGASLYPTSRESSGVGSSHGSELDTSMSLPHGTVQIPLEYYQHLQQLAMLNPVLSVQKGNFVGTPLVQPLPQEAREATKLSAPVQPNVSINSAKRETMVPTSEIYEEIANSKMYVDVPKLPAPRATCQEPTENSTDSLLRRKKNPIYNDGDEADSPAEPLAPDYTHKEKQHNRYCNKCTCIAFLLLAILSCTALTISLLLATGVLSLNKDTFADQNHVAPSQQVVQRIIVRGDNSSITDFLNVFQQSIDNKTDFLHHKIELLEVKLKNLTENQLVQEEGIRTLSDRLPTGVIDPRLCVHKSSRRIIDDSRSNNVTTQWSPNYTFNEDYKDFVLVAASCTTDNYLSTNLETREFAGKTQYLCRCVGLRDSSSNARCAIDYWMCPTIT